MKRTALVLLMGLVAAFGARAQEDDKPEGGPEQGAERTEERGERPESRSTIKPYEKVITDEAVTHAGVFKVHRIKEKLFYEIPVSELGKEFVLVTQIAKTAPGAGFGGQPLGRRIVKWDRHGERVLLKSVSYSLVADPSSPVARAVEASNLDAILMAFDIQAFGPDEAPVIEVTRLYTTEAPEFSARSRLGARGFDARRSFLERASAYPANIEVRATHTYTSPPSTTPERGEEEEAPRTRQMAPGSATVVVSYSMVKLPEQPMTPRLFDPRVGYFSVSQLDYGLDEHKAAERRYITRYRLEKKDPNAEMSEPVKPIVYWIDPATPEKWRPYIARGIEKWQPAFEAAGFKNAIIAKQGPTPEEDPDWSPEDARYSVIRWLPSTVQNARGPHINDPRTGEILEADVEMHHNVMNLVRNWYFTQVGPLDPRAKRLPLPDDLMGELIEYVVAHEVGHTLGFQHNMKASSTYPAEKLRDPEWVKTMSHTPTLMDYSRFNYVAQPEDGIDPKFLIPIIGPYDVWATVWGYKPIPGAKTPDDEKATLNEWALAQDETPWLRFSTAGSGGTDPGELTEAVGDEDAVKSTALGMKNLERVAAMLLEATTTKPGEPYDDLAELYDNLVGQWTRELGHVVALVGGVYSRQKHIGQDGARFEPVPPEKQKEAVLFLCNNSFRAPEFLLDAEVLRRIEPAGALARISRSQRRILESLLGNSRLERLIEQSALNPGGAYRPDEFLAMLRDELFAEGRQASVTIDALRRDLQRGYVEVLAEKANMTSLSANDVRALARGELGSLKVLVAQLTPKVADRMTEFHLRDLTDRIEQALKNEGAGAQPVRRAVTEALEDHELDCWPNYAPDDLGF